MRLVGSSGFGCLFDLQIVEPAVYCRGREFNSRAWTSTKMDKKNSICTCSMHAALEYNATAVSLLRKAAVCSVFCPLYQIKVLLYHMIQPTKASIAHMESCRREFVRQLYIMSKYIFLSGFQQKLGYEYDYGDYNHKWDSMRRQHRWIICLSTTVGSDDKIELKIKLKSPWECQWSSCTPQSREASPCLSNDVLLHRCSTGHQSSTGPGSEANR